MKIIEITAYKIDQRKKTCFCKKMKLCDNNNVGEFGELVLWLAMATRDKVTKKLLTEISC